MNRRLVAFGLAGAVGAAWLSVGCDEFLPCDETKGCRQTFPASDTGLDNLIPGKGVGEDCSSEACREGLACVSDECEPAGSLEEGDQCVIGAECEKGLSCALGACPLEFLDVCPVCTRTGSAEAGESCDSDLDCASGLKCTIVGFASQCVQAGTSDRGQSCDKQTDCSQGLFCNEGNCALEPPIFEGVECPEPDEDNVIAYFSVPGASDTPDDADYFQFPFPNDFRIGSDGRPDLGAFPTPGPGLSDVDLVERYVEAIEANTLGWSTNPTVIFRFSGPFDWNSFQVDSEGFRGVEIIDVDNLPADPEDGVFHHSTHYSAAGRSNYVCDNWFAVRSPRNTLVPGHRYVVLLRGGKDKKGNAIGRSKQFQAMLEPSAPSDSVLKQAHAAHAPLRELIAFYKGSSFELDPEEINVATVFTTFDVQDPMRKLAESVAEAEMPQIRDWVKCDTGVESPCSQAEVAEGRACGSGTDAYDEYQALIELPIFQQGEAPYLESGGAIQSAVQRTEEVCLSLSLPVGTAPASGWPLVIYGHGTGGSYRSPLSSTVAGRLAEGGIATLGFDQVEHGPRRGGGEGSDQDPDNLFFNFANPDAARGNPLQGAADVLGVLRAVSQGELASASDTGASTVNIDPNKIVLYGHSQGATHSSIALPFSSVPGGVLSGNGGGLVEALLNKTNPINIAGAIPYVVQDVDHDGSLRMGDKHPVLALLQHYIDPADPVNFAALLAVRPEEGQGLKSVFQTFGLDDTYSPPATLARYVQASQRMVLAPAPSGVNPTGENALSVAQSSDPVSENVVIGTDKATLVCRQYNPISDGHFVADEVSAATDDVIGFLSSLLEGDSPVIPAP